MKHIPVILFGIGNVGRTLIRQIIDSRDVVANRNNLYFDIVALVDSRGWIYQIEGIDNQQLIKEIADKETGMPLSRPRVDEVEIIDQLYSDGLRQGIVVDVTAASGMEPLIEKTLDTDFGVVLANKKPLTGRWSSAQRFYIEPRLRYESTVGGGQPVISTIRYLRDTNDHILAVEGQLSGTMGYICGRLDQGAPFSTAVLEARSKGFTEPDPREDLGGMDVKRKILILARLAGWPLEDEDIEVDSLYHPALAHLDVDEFLQAVVAMDPAMLDRANAAMDSGQVLRYVARVNQNGGSVGLTSVLTGSPLANMKYISFKTGYYEDEPLLIAGKGAGLKMTAAGVLGDMIGLAREEL